MWAGLRDLGITDRDACLRVISDWLGRDVASSTSLTEAEAGTVLDKIREGRDQLAQRQAAEQAAAAAEAGQPEPGDPGADEPAPDYPDDPPPE